MSQGYVIDDIICVINYYIRTKHLVSSTLSYRVRVSKYATAVAYTTLIVIGVVEERYGRPDG